MADPHLRAKLQTGGPVLIQQAGAGAQLAKPFAVFGRMQEVPFITLNKLSAAVVSVHQNALLMMFVLPLIDQDGMNVLMDTQSLVLSMVMDTTSITLKSSGAAKLLVEFQAMTLF